MGLDRAERLKQDYGVEVEWKAFEIRPGTPLEGIPRHQKPGEVKELSPNIKNLSDEIGLQMKRPTFLACSRPALEAAEYAKEQAKFDQFHLATFKAYWEEGRNIGLISILRDVAERCGLDGDELEHCLNEGRYTERIDRQNEEARALGINGIPAYIVGGYLVEGAQPYEIFQRAMELVQK
ncbi:DsbA family protein [Chloroflexota bacterium]